MKRKSLFAMSACVRSAQVQPAGVLPVGARLLGARLLGARLLGATLLGATLLGATLLGARLLGARLLGARLLGARLLGLMVAEVLSASVILAGVLLAGFISAGVHLALPPAHAAEPSVPLCQPWQSEYRGQDATGKHVLALWKFDAGEKVEDASGHGHTATLRGAKIHPRGRFGGCLECFPGWPVEDKEHRALVQSHPALSPQGPFSLEMWICPKPELEGYPEAFLVDKKYVSQHDYQLILGPADRAGNRVLRACLGFGDDSATFYAQPARFRPGTWYHVAFTYDGAGGGRFFLDGRPWGEHRVAGRESIAAGRHPLSIGDRIGSYYHGFPGFIDEVRLCTGALEFRPIKVEIVTERSSFLRMEPAAALGFRITSLWPQPITAAEVSISTDGLGRRTRGLGPLGPGQAASLEYPLDTSLRPGEYHVMVRLDVPGPETFQSEERFPVRIVARRPPDRFPVVMWGVGSPEGVLRELGRLKRIGFNHVLGFGADYARIWEAGKPTEAASPEVVATTRRMLDEALAQEMTIVASLAPGRWAARNPAFQRVDRKGQPYQTKTPDVCGLFPQVQQFCYNVGASVANSYGGFPAFQAAMLHTEVRDHANLCFHPHDRAAFRNSAGLDVPPEVGNRHGVQYTRLPGFPASRVIPDDHPLYVFYRWFWKEGDGWNGLNTALHRGLKSGRPDLWTYHDPAVRVASVYGSGGQVDVLSQWTYSYPDPIRIAVATDELLAMAAGASQPQRVMKMTQIIWYRSQTAPAPKEGSPSAPPAYQAPWERQQPDAPFITIAPMHLREAFWTKIARPIKGIMYHGWQSLVPCDSPASYRYTHPETQHELARLIHQVVEPLGPMLLHVPAAKSDVAFLESFAAQMFAGRGTYGWGGSWCGDAYHVMLYAHLQPEIVFDETIAQRGLDGFKLLVMPDCDVLPASVARHVQAFQAQGGLVVGDERLAPAIKPDVILDRVARTGRGDRDKAALQAAAAALRKQLDSRYRRYLDTSHPDVIPYLRRFGQSDYVFLVNDRREFGQYVGHHGIVMENGLPAQATVFLNRPAGFVYDLLAGRPVPTRQEQGQLRWDAALGPCDGAVYVVTPRPLQGCRITAPESAPRGGTAPCTIEVLDDRGQPVDAVLPLKVSVYDPETRLAEFSGYYAAKAGKTQLTLQIAPNDPPGTWQIEVRELASGLSAVHWLRVPGPEPWPPHKTPPPPGAANPVQPHG